MTNDKLRIGRVELLLDRILELKDLAVEQELDPTDLQFVICYLS